MSSAQHQQSNSASRSTNNTSASSPQQPTQDQQQQQSANQNDFYFHDQQHFHPHAHATRSHALPQQTIYQHPQHPTSSMSPPAHSMAVPNPQHSSQLPTSSFNSTPQHHLPSTDYDTSQLASIADDQNEEDGLREQDRLLPIANVSRIMKQAVPPAAKISKDAKDTVLVINIIPFHLIILFYLFRFKNV